MAESHSGLRARLKRSGHKLTHARIIVLAALEASGGHITSTELLERVQAADSGIGRATIFRTLDLFTRIGIVRPTYIGTSTTPTYVLMPEGHHHHVICTNCNLVIEFDECDLDDLATRLEAQLNVQLSGHLLEFYGLCADCCAISAEQGDD
ncbi:MAG: transcriptional repressor [Chloroflexi bacterium]|nr:transcriptional repressor [Chloroflexota bacterium]